MSDYFLSLQTILLLNDVWREYNLWALANEENQ